VASGAYNIAVFLLFITFSIARPAAHDRLLMKYLEMVLVSHTRLRCDSVAIINIPDAEAIALVVTAIAGETGIV
jgi:hypothetical protein